MLGDPKQVPCPLCTSVSLFVHGATFQGGLVASIQKLGLHSPSFLSPRTPVRVVPAPLRKNRPLTPAMNPTGLSSALCGRGPSTQSPPEVGRAGARGWGAGGDTSDLSGHGSPGSVAHSQDGRLHWPSSPRRVDGGAVCPRARPSVADVSGVCTLAHLAGPPDWFGHLHMSPAHG